MNLTNDEIIYSLMIVVSDELDIELKISEGYLYDFLIV